MKRKLGMGALAAFAGIAAALVGSASAQAPQPVEEKPAELERQFRPESSPDAGTPMEGEDSATGGSGFEGANDPGDTSEAGTPAPTPTPTPAPEQTRL